MSFIALIDITKPDAVFPPEGTLPVLNLPDRQDRDLWIPKLIRSKRPFAIASLDAVSQEEVIRLAETSRHRKLPVAILNAYRLIPVFARLREVVVSGCLGTMETVQVHVPTATSAILCADLAHWLLPAASAEALSITADNRLTVVATGSNGRADAMLDMNARKAFLSTHIGEIHREIAVPEMISALMAERDIRANTLPAAHRWPLLMHADDAASAITMADAFTTNGKK